MQDTRRRWPKIPAVIGSLWLAGVVLFWDIGIEGFYSLSLLICPLWLLISLCKNVIWRPGWGIAVFRVAMPVLTLAITVNNAHFQWKVSDANAERVVRACDEFHLANGRYPETLDELVPGFLSFVPPAKYCTLGNFWYVNHRDHCRLWWCRYGFYRRTYDFDTKQWGNLD